MCRNEKDIYKKYTGMDAARDNAVKQRQLNSSSVQLSPTQKCFTCAQKYIESVYSLVFIISRRVTWVPQNTNCGGLYRTMFYTKYSIAPYRRTPIVEVCIEQCSTQSIVLLRPSAKTRDS